MPRIRRLSLIFILSLWGLWLASPAMGANPLVVDGAKPRRIVVMAPGASWSESALDGPPMLRRLRGVVAVLEGPDIAAFFRVIPTRRSTPNLAPPILEESGDRIAYVLRLQGRRSWNEIQVYESEVGEAHLAAEGGYSAEFDLVAFNTILGAGRLYAGDFSSADPEEPGVVRRLVSTTRFVTIDPPTLRDRLFGSIPAMTRGSELRPRGSALAVRYPAGLSERELPGLLIWITPSDGWMVPKELHQALDELGLICIGALESGNERFVNDRLQLALDAAGTALARWPIDPRRIHVTGMSGGAKMATMLWAGWPEVFAGSIPIVGLASHLALPAGPGRVYPALFSEPKSSRLELVRRHRLAAMTGPTDYNYRSMVTMIRGYELKQFAVRMFEFADMAHTMPTPERFAEALAWIDEPYRELRAGERQAAEAALEKYQATLGEPGPRDEAGRKALKEVMRVGPWTPAAWKAWELLQKFPAP